MGILRFTLAILLALLHLDLESSWNMHSNYSFKTISNLNGKEAVNIFYLISGFIIALTFSKNYQHENFLLKTTNYYLNRILRIYPLYFVSLFVFFLDGYFLNIISTSIDNPFIRYDNLKNIFIIFHEKGSFINSVAWTLDFELRWYLLIPIIFFIKKNFYKNNYYKYFFILVIIIFLILEIILLYNAKKVLLNAGYRDIFYFGDTLFYFLIGYLIYEFYKVYNFEVSKFHFRIGLLFLLFAFIAPDTPIIIFYLIAVYICFTANFKNHYDKFFGDLSYPIYILHYPVMLPIYLQVNKYINFLDISDIYSYFIIYFITITIFCFICHLSILFFQNPIDRFRLKFKKSI